MRPQAVLSSVLLLLAIAPFEWQVLLWLAWVPLLWSSVRAKTRAEAARTGAAFGFLYYALFFRWIPHVHQLVFVYCGVCLLGTLFGAYFGVGVHAVRRLPAWARVALIPLLWTAPALIAGNPVRPFFESLLLLVGLHAPLSLPYFQLAAVLGEVGLVFFILLVNALLWQAVENHKRAGRAAAFLAGAAGLLLGGWVWGRGQVRAFDEHPWHPPFRVACAQHDMPFAWEWRAAHQDEIHSTYQEMALQAAAKGADMVLFPQYQIPGDIFRQPEPWGAIAKKAGIYMSLGTYTPVKPMAFGKNAWVTALAFSPDGSLLGVQKALHPNPGGRPMVVAGETADPIVLPSLGKLAILSCFDDVTPRPARMFSTSHPDLFVSNANDGPFKGTIHPFLHEMRTRLRAVESRSWFVRCTPNGISSVIDPLGRVRQALPEGKGLLYSEW